MMPSGQKGNMNKIYKIQLADAHIEHVWLNLVLKGFHGLWFFFLHSVAHLYLFYGIEIILIISGFRKMQVKLQK